ncbi:DoxX family protein [Burkholderia sp. AU31624]|uniref:DoxX family protein n=1 Tax=Burkholderia TaxID=32008 RepID=UPI000B7A7451|nr:MULTISPECIES: DoxX family protein [Burkholderia]MCA8060756.1 DoxX family protein [Burkholderia sp. AU38729]MCA8252613.1 DoxX family protein [Burkholderia sp. AU31624]OXI16958.1 AraC family transcriptional regulator [Burkholderia sp. AU15512]RQT25740.1 DoxX family protein [Burkholderia contaminans]VWD34837.1 AraC family transcriptional regulator [Burkholderia contaminans]
MTIRPLLSNTLHDFLLLIARVLIISLYLKIGIPKLLDFGGAVAYMTRIDAPLPMLSAVILIAMDVVVAIAILIGFHTRPLALLLALYTLGAAIIGHPFWVIDGPRQMTDMIHFYKNLSIMGGLLALYSAGPGRFSIDRG